METPIAIYEKENPLFVFWVVGSLSVCNIILLSNLYLQNLLIVAAMIFCSITIWITLFKIVRPELITQRLLLYKDRLQVEISQNTTIPISSIKSIRVVSYAQRAMMYGHEYVSEYEILHEAGALRFESGEGSTPLLKGIVKLTGIQVQGLEAMWN